MEYLAGEMDILELQDLCNSYYDLMEVVKCEDTIDNLAVKTYTLCLTVSTTDESSDAALLLAQLIEGECAVYKDSRDLIPGEHEIMQEANLWRQCARNPKTSKSPTFRNPGAHRAPADREEHHEEDRVLDSGLRLVAVPYGVWRGSTNTRAGRHGHNGPDDISISIIMGNHTEQRYGHSGNIRGWQLKRMFSGSW